MGIIIDSFDTVERDFKTVCECEDSMDVIRDFARRQPIEAVYRLMYELGYLSSKKPWVKFFHKKGHEVFFEMDMTEMLIKEPALKRRMNALLKGDSKLYWERISNT